MLIVICMGSGKRKSKNQEGLINTGILFTTHMDKYTCFIISFRPPQQQFHQFPDGSLLLHIPTGRPSPDIPRKTPRFPPAPPGRNLSCDKEIRLLSHLQRSAFHLFAQHSRRLRRIGSKSLKGSQGLPRQIKFHHPQHLFIRIHGLYRRIAGSADTRRLPSALLMESAASPFPLAETAHSSSDSACPSRKIPAEPSAPPADA